MKLLNFMQLAEETVDIDPNCQGLGFIVKIVKHGIFPILQIGIPIILIVLGTLDLGKAVISSDEKEVKAAQSRLMKRCIYAVAVFFIVTIVQLVFNLINNVAASNAGNLTGWWTCWSNI